VVQDRFPPAAQPRLFDMQRDWVGPSFDACIERKQAVPAPAVPSAFGICHEDTDAFRLRAARECLDLLGTLRTHREPQAGETWRAPMASERRLVAQLHAVLVLGPPALKQAERLALDPDVPDGDRVFAGLLVLASTTDVEYVQRCVPLFEAAVQRDRTEAAAAVEALCLSPSPAVAEVLDPLLKHVNVAVRAAAVRVLSYRGELATRPWCEAVTDPDPRVAVPALGGALQHIDRDAAEVVLKPLYTHESETLARAALRSGMALALPSASQAARTLAATSPSWADALYLVALLGQPQDRRLLEGAMLQHLDVAARACARSGWLPLGSRLIATLAGQPADTRAAAGVASALSTLAACTVEPTTGPDAWAGAWIDATRTLDEGLRHRHGRPLSLHAMAHELRTGRLSRPQRQELYFEMQVLTQGRLPRFNAFDFIGCQHDELDRLDALLSATNRD
jgi:hypothetical protein